jgi:hypothetical protein
MWGRLDQSGGFCEPHFSGYSAVDIGRGNGLPADRKAYGDTSPFPFTGTVEKN